MKNTIFIIAILFSLNNAFSQKDTSNYSIYGGPKLYQTIKIPGPELYKIDNLLLDSITYNQLSITDTLDIKCKNCKNKIKRFFAKRFGIEIKCLKSNKKNMFIPKYKTRLIYIINDEYIKRRSSKLKNLNYKNIDTIFILKSKLAKKKYGKKGKNGAIVIKTNNKIKIKE